MPSLMQYLCNLNMLDLTQRTFTCSKLTMETAQLYTISVQSQQQRHQNHVTDVVRVSVVKFKQISYIFLVFPLVTLNKSVPAEPVAQRRSVEKVFLKFLQNSLENTCARASFLIKLQALGLQPCNFIKKETLAQGFSCELCEISKNTLFAEHLRWLLLYRLGKSDICLGINI